MRLLHSLSVLLQLRIHVNLHCFWKNTLKKLDTIDWFWCCQYYCLSILSFRVILDSLGDTNLQFILKNHNIHRKSWVIPRVTNHQLLRVTYSKHQLRPKTWLDGQFGSNQKGKKHQLFPFCLEWTRKRTQLTGVCKTYSVRRRRCAATRGQSPMINKQRHDSSFFTHVPIRIKTFFRDASSRVKTVAGHPRSWGAKSHNR